MARRDSTWHKGWASSTSGTACTHGKRAILTGPNRRQAARNVWMVLKYKSKNTGMNLWKSRDRVENETVPHLGLEERESELIGELGGKKLILKRKMSQQSRSYRTMCQSAGLPDVACIPHKESAGMDSETSIGPVDMFQSALGWKHGNPTHE